jgi:hypothetical protein
MLAGRDELNTDDGTMHGHLSKYVAEDNLLGYRRFDGGVAHR